MSAHTSGSAVTGTYSLNERLHELETRLAALEHRVEGAAGTHHEPEGCRTLPSLPPDADAAVAWLVNYKATDRR